MATGYFGSPNRLGVPGESQPHVHYRFTRRAHGVRPGRGGGRRRATRRSTRRSICYRAGARVTLVHFGDAARPERQAMGAPRHRGPHQGRRDHRAVSTHAWSRSAVTGWRSSAERRRASGSRRSMCSRCSATCRRRRCSSRCRRRSIRETGIPTHNPATMETPLPGLFIAGVLASGFDANKTFIENGRFHGDLIAARHRRRQHAARRGV